MPSSFSYLTTFSRNLRKFIFFIMVNTRSSSTPTRKTLQSAVLQQQRLNESTTSGINTNKCCKSARDLIVKPIIEQVIKSKLSHPNLRHPKNHLNEVFQKYKAHFPWLTMDMLKGRLKRWSKSQQQPINTPTDIPIQSALPSNTTESTSITNTSTSTTTTPTSSNHAPVNSPTTTVSPPPLHLNNVTASPTTRTKGGRPVGSTNDNAVHINKCLISAKAEITYLYQKECERSIDSGKSRMSMGTYKRIHEEIKVKRNLPADFLFLYNNTKKRM
jgi:hypothetical protein